MKDVNTLKGFHSIRTLKSIKSISIPGFRGSNYLDLYILKIEKEILLKEDERLCMRRDIIKKRLEEIDMEMNNLQEVEAGVKDNGNGSSSIDTFTQKDEIKKDWKKMSLNY